MGFLRSASILAQIIAAMVWLAERSKPGWIEPSGSVWPLRGYPRET